MRNRIIFTPPDVDPVQPPKIRKKRRTNCAEADQETKSPGVPAPSVFPKPPLEPRVITLKEALLKAVEKDAPSAVKMSVTKITPLTTSVINDLNSESFP